MAQFSDTRKLQHGFFHSLSKASTEATQSPYESVYKSGHSIYPQDVFTDTIGFAEDEAAADLFVLNNPTIIRKYTQFTLTSVAGSNNQAYSLIDSGQHIRPFITPVDIVSSTGNLSFGYDIRIYKQNGDLIPPTLGAWNVDPYSGLILFDTGYTPVDLGWGDISITCYVYIGATLINNSAGGNLIIKGLSILGVDGNQASILTSESTPEGVLSAGVGSLCLSGDGNIYKKYTGETSTGWVILGDTDMTLTKRVNNNGDYIYIGEASVGSLESDSVWRISRTYISPIDGDIIILWANGTSNFDKVWNDHLSLSYS